MTPPLAAAGRPESESAACARVAAALPRPLATSGPGRGGVSPRQSVPMCSLASPPLRPATPASEAAAGQFSARKISPPPPLAAGPGCGRRPGPPQARALVGVYARSHWPRSPPRSRWPITRAHRGRGNRPRRTLRR
jgi:hypothetical protein